MLEEFYNMPIEYIECDCHSEFLQLTFEEDKENINLNFLYISLYSEGNFIKKTKWIKRLRHIWYIIKYGIPYADQICLRTEDIKKLRDYLNKLKID